MANTDNWEDVTASNDGWEDVHPVAGKGPAVPFQSGSAFKDTKDLIPSMKDIEDIWDKFKAELSGNKSLAELQAAAAKSPEARAAIEAKLRGDVGNARGLGSSLIDNAGALPAMVAGGVHGIYDAVRKGDATAGLKTASETMNKFMPSTIIGNGADHDNAGYKAGMAPVTALMDTLNAVPQGYGEMLNAAGMPNAAAQVTDAGKLGIMVGGAALGAHEMAKGRGGDLDTSHADKLEAATKGWEDVTPSPTADIGGTIAHADDFAAVNPYDVGGHVSASEQGRPSVVDSPQGDLFGGEMLNQPAETPIPQDGLVRNYDAIPYEKTSPLSLVPKDEAKPSAEMGLNMPEQDVPNMGLEPKDRISGSELQDSPARSFFLDPKNRDKLDFHTFDPRNNPKFREWFGNSKIVDMDGKPQVMYHGTARDISEFHPDQAGSIYVTPSSRFAEQFAENSAGRGDGYGQNIMPVHVKVEKPFDYTNARDLQSLEYYLDSHTPNGWIQFEDGKGHKSTISVGTIMGRIREGSWLTVESPTVQAAIKHMGHDGYFIHENGVKNLAVYKSEQIKSATGNRGTFDRNSSRIDHQFAGEILGDATVMNPEATHTMVDSLRKGDVNGALDSIIQDHGSAAYRNLANYLKGKLDDLKIQVHDEGILDMGDRQATGYYDPESHTVGLSRVGAASPHTVLHEMVHAMTSDFVNRRPNDMRVMGLKDLFNKLNDLGMQKEFPDVSNVKEFLAEAFSNPEFQDFLKEHRIQERSTWRRFVDNVKSMLGFSSATRNHITDALEHTMDLGKQVMDAGKDGDRETLKDSGMPGKLADLMISRDKRPEPSKTPDLTKLKVPGLKDAISDFKFDDRPMPEIIKDAQASPDIPDTLLERLSHQLQAGGLFESLKTRNPVVKATYERVTRASQEYARNIKEYLTDPKTGLKAYMRDLTPDEKGQIHSMMILNEGKRELSNLELRQAGMTDKQIAYYNKAREQDNRFFNEINQRRQELGMEPIDKRVAHMAGRFMGDFSRFVFDKDGKIVGRISGNTKWELDRATKYMAEQHPEWQMGKQDYNRLGRGKNSADRFGGLMEALNFITKTDSDAAKLLESYRGYLQKDAIGYLNAVRHAKAKVNEAGGIKGSEGNKPWLDTVKNAEEGMKAQLAYFEQGYKWMAMEKAVHDLKPLLGDEKLALNTPNALQWGREYLNHALGREQGVLSDAANWTASMIGEYSGIGHSNLFKMNAKLKHITMQKFMGLLNIPFSITQMMQPFQVHPPMLALLKNRGLEFSAIDAQTKAVSTFLNALTDEKTGKLGAFDKQALDYAERMGIMDVKMADHTKDINQSKLYEAYSKIADVNIEIPERLTRGTSFLFYSHILKDAGVPVKDVFGAAENLTNMTMVNYHPIERPMGYAKLGWLGDVASTLTRYKHNQLSQAAFYTREGINSGSVRGYTPLAAFLGTTLAFGGVMGFFGYNEADAAYQQVSEWMGKPDTLTNVLFKHNTPELITHGLFSTLGLDMTTRFSNANVLPDSVGKALMPYGSAVMDMVTTAGRLAMDPLSTTKQKQALKAFAPQSIQGVLENKMFTDKLPDGRNLYVNGTDGPNVGKGRVYRSDDDMSLRSLGFRDIRESKELAKNYSDSQINTAKSDLGKGMLNKVKYEAMDGTLTAAKLAEYVNKAATQYDVDPNSFVSELASWEGARRLSQADQIKLRNALGGFTGAMRAKEGR